MAKGWLEKNGKILYSYDTDRNKFWTITNVKFHPDYPCSCWIGSSNLCPHQIHIAHKSKNHPNVNFDQENLSKLTVVSVYVIRSMQSIMVRYVMIRFLENLRQVVAGAFIDSLTARTSNSSFTHTALMWFTLGSCIRSKGLSAANPFFGNQTRVISSLLFGGETVREVTTPYACMHRFTCKRTWRGAHVQTPHTHTDS